MPEDPLPGKCLPATALEARRYRSASKALAARTPRAGRLLVMEPLDVLANSGPSHRARLAWLFSDTRDASREVQSPCLNASPVPLLTRSLPAFPVDARRKRVKAGRNRSRRIWGSGGPHRAHGEKCADRGISVVQERQALQESVRRASPFSIARDNDKSAGRQCRGDGGLGLGTGCGLCRDGRGRFLDGRRQESSTCQRRPRQRPAPGKEGPHTRAAALGPPRPGETVLDHRESQARNAARVLHDATRPAGRRRTGDARAPS
jgi:hypothetical protein